MLNRASTQEFRWHNNYLKAADNDYPLHLNSDAKSVQAGRPWSL